MTVYGFEAQRGSEGRGAASSRGVPSTERLCVADDTISALNKAKLESCGAFVRKT